MNLGARVTSTFKSMTCNSFFCQKLGLLQLTVDAREKHFQNEKNILACNSFYQHNPGEMGQFRIAIPDFPED